MSRTPSDPPSDFTDPMKTRYRNLREMLRKQGTFQDVDAPTLAKWVRAEFRQDNIRAALRTIAKELEKELGRPVSPDELTVKGSRGQEVDHPLVKRLREAEQDAQGFARDLLMTSAARAGKDIKSPKGKGRLGL